MIARKIKGCKIEIQPNNELIDELESYTLLNLTSSDLYHLIMTANMQKSAYEEDGKVYIVYAHNDSIDLLWNSIVQEHEEVSGEKFKNISIRYTSPLNEKFITGYLFRNQNKHNIMFIDKADKAHCSTQNSINFLAINQGVEYLFLKDLVRSGEDKSITSNKMEFYHYWSNFMTFSYLKNTHQN